MKTLFICLLLSAVPAAAQTHQVLLVRGNAASASPYINVITSTVTPGSTVNLSSATQDWRDFTEPSGAPSVACQSPSECFGDRKLGGTGIMGVHGNGGSDSNYNSNGVPSIASLTHTDGAVTTSGSSGTYYSFATHDYTLTAFADNQVEKTLTVYVAMIDYYSGGTPTKSADAASSVTISFSDSSVTPVTSMISSSAAANDGLKKIQIKYRSGSDGREIYIRVAQLTTGTNASLVFAGATLDSAYTPSITRAIPMGADLQAEANGLFRTGDVQLFPDGYVYSSALLIPARDGITMKTSLNLAAGVQVLASEVKAKISPPYNYAGCAVALQSGVTHFSIDGFEVTQDSSAAHPADSVGVFCVQPTQILRPGSGSSVAYNVTASDLPSDISVTHMYIHGQPLTVGPTFAVETSGRHLCVNNAQFENVTSNGCFNVGVITDGNRVTIADSVIVDFIGQEANAVINHIGQHVLITNNQIEANGENVMIFASPVYYPPDTVYNAANSSQLPPGGGLFPNYTEVSLNHIFKDPSYCLIARTKNLIENKNGKYTSIHDNLLELSCEGTFSQGQHGMAIAIAIRTRNGYCNTFSCGSGDTIAATPWSPTQHIDVYRNIIRHVNRGVTFQGPYDDYYCSDLSGGATAPPSALTNQAILEGVTGRGTDWKIHDNYIADIDPSKYGTVAGQVTYSASGVTNEAACFYGPGGDDLHVYNNNCVFAHPVVGSVVPSFTQFGITSPDHTVTVDDNKGWDMITITRSFFLHNRYVCGGTDLMQQTTGLQFYNNVLGAEIGGDSLGGLEILDADSSYGGWANFTFRNNNIQNSFADWSGVTAANTAAPGQYAGNTINTAAPSGTGAPLTSLFAGECAVRYGNRAELIAGCTTPTQ